MHICADRLIHALEVCLRENPSWGNARVVLAADGIFLAKERDFVRVSTTHVKISEVSKQLELF
jgi:hypothetical protein